MLITERYKERITGIISCYDRIVIHGTLPFFSKTVSTDNRFYKGINFYSDAIKCFSKSWHGESLTSTACKTVLFGNFSPVKATALFSGYSND